MHVTLHFMRKLIKLVLVAPAVRKAYRKRALATHPDRFATKSEAEKSLAEEQFRKVSGVLARHRLHG